MSRNTKIVTIAVVVLVGAIAGYLLGSQIGKKSERAEADQKIQEIQHSLNIFVPPLPDVINTIGGKITAVNSDAFTFIMEVPSFTDRYPKPGVPMATEIRTVRAVADTEITDTNFDSKTFKKGVPQTKTISAGDLQVGDTVSVTVKENARTEQNLTAVSINRSSGI